MMSSWFNPKPTGDPGRDRNARTLQFTCLLFALANGIIAALDLTAQEWELLPILGLAVAGFVAAAVMNRAGRSAWAARTVLMVFLMNAILLVFEARDGFRSLAMLFFPALLLISVMLLDRLSYLTAAGIILVAVAALGVAEQHGLTRAIPGVRSPTSYENILYVDLFMLVFAAVGSRIARDTQTNVFELRATIDRLSEANLELREAGVALRESEERFRATFFQAAVGIAQTSVDRRWMLLNDQFCKMLGYSRAELNGKTFLEVTHPDDRELSLNTVRQLLSGEISSWSKEKRYIRKDGATVWARVFTSLVRGQHDQPKYFITAVEDITDKIQAERALRDSEQRLTMAQNAAYLGVWDRDMRTDVITICGKYAELHGLSPDRTTLRHEEWVSLIHPNDRDRVQALRRDARERTHIFDSEFRVIWSEGSIHWLHAKGAVLLDDSGHPTRSMGVIWDTTERKQAEAALRESEERFRNMADAAPVLIWVSGLDKLYTFFNKPWLDFTGRTIDEELGNGWGGGVHQEDLDRCLETYNSSFDARRSFQMEYRLRRADGEYRWILENATPLYRGSEFAGYIGSCVDITEQKLIEEQLRASKVQLMDAQRLANLGSWDRDIATGRINWSDEMYRVSGLETPPQTFPAYLETVHPKDRERVRQASDKARSSTSPEVVSYRIIRPDGEVRFVSAIVEAIREEGRVIRLVGAIQDTTEQFKAQELLRESEKRLKRAEQLAQLGHWDWDLRSGRVYWSEEVFRISGQAPDYTPSYKDILQHVVPQERERVDRAVTNALERKSGFLVEFQIARPNGELRTLKSISEVVLDEDGKLVRLFGTVQDITDSKRAQEEAFGRQKLESIGTLASGIAHDFNNLLGGVLAQAELALGELAAGSNPEEELKAIHDVALRGSEIVRELMIYAGKETAVVGHVDVSQIVKEMLQLLKVSVSKHSMLEADLGKDLPAVRANAAQLRQIVLNLVTNASDAIGDRDGVIRVVTKRVRPRSDAPGWISGRLAESDYVQLEVSDTGCGISSEIQTKMFDPFFTTKSAGRGLGLAIVDRIARDLGGAIHVTSESGKGSTFQVLLPCAETATESGERISGIELLPRPGQHATILIVEDEGPIRQAVTKMLRKAGFEVFVVVDGSSAIDLVRVNGDKIDLILLDMTIPGASSREVVAEAAKVRPDVKVILTSAYSKEMVEGAINAPQIHGFVRKPFQIGDLVKTLRNALPVG